MGVRQGRRLSARAAHWIVWAASVVTAGALIATVHRKFDRPTEVTILLLGLWLIALLVTQRLERVIVGEHGATRRQLHVVEDHVDQMERVLADNVIPLHRDQPTMVLRVVGTAAAGPARVAPPRGLSYTAGDHTIGSYLRRVMDEEATG